MPIRGVAGNLITRKKHRVRQTKRRKIDSPKLIKVQRKKSTRRRDANPIRHYTGYALILEGGFYYVGITARADVYQRYAEHTSGKGSKWTRLHKPVKIIETRDFGIRALSSAAKLEDEMTLEYMKKYGMYLVRGGGLCQVKDQEVARRYNSVTSVKIISPSSQYMGTDPIYHELAWLMVQE